MKRHITIIILIIITIALISFFMLPKDFSGKTKNSATYHVNNGDIIKTAVPGKQSFTNFCSWFGTVDSKNKTRIIALENGRIVSIAVKDGDSVTNGDLLFSIGGPLLDNKIKRLQKKSEILQNRIKFANQLVEIKRKAVAKQFSKKEELIAAEDTLARLKVEMESCMQAKQQLQESAYLRATIRGVFTARKVSVGQEVKKGDELASIISQDHIYITATLFPQNKNILLKNKQAIINLPGGTTVKGVVAAVMPQKTKEGATIIQIQGTNLASKLNSGQSVSGMVILSVHTNALAISEDAIVRDENEQACVFVQNSSGYHKQMIKTGIIVGNQVEVISGLNPDDKVVIQGAYELFYQDFNKIYKVVD